MYQVSNLNNKLLFFTSLSSSILNLDFGFKIETKFFILYERMKFELYTFEKFSPKNKFEYFYLIISNFEKKTKTKTNQKVRINNS